MRATMLGFPASAFDARKGVGSKAHHERGAGIKAQPPPFTLLLT